MGQQKQDRKFVNGFYGKRVWADGDNELFGIGLKKKDFIKNIEAIPEDANGFINLTMGSQKADHDKFSLWPREEKKQSSSSSTSSQAPSSSSLPPADDTDDLPF